MKVGSSGATDAEVAVEVDVDAEELSSLSTFWSSAADACPARRAADTAAATVLNLILQTKCSQARTSSAEGERQQAAN